MTLETLTSLFFNSRVKRLWIKAAVANDRCTQTVLEDSASDPVLFECATVGKNTHERFEVVRVLCGKQRGLSDAMVSTSRGDCSIPAIVDARRNRWSMWLELFKGDGTSVLLVLALAIATPAYAKSEGTAPAVNVLEVKVKQDGKRQPPKNALVKVETYFLEVIGKPKCLQGLLKDQGPGTSILALSAPSQETPESILKAAEKVKGVRVLTAPKMTVFSKHKASFEAIRKMPYATDWAKTVSTGEWEAVSFAKKDVGIKLAVTPLVNTHGMISLRIVPEVTQFDGFLEESPSTSSSGVGSSRKQAVFSTQRLTSEVLMNPGDSVMISGAESENAVEIKDKVPLFGNLPIIGRLFRSTSYGRTRILILVRAHIVDPSQITAEK